MRQTNDSLTNKYNYTCEFCRIDYIPNRRFFQKYCSNSCRSKAYYHRNKSIINNDEELIIKKSKKKENKKKNKIDSMSLAGVGNATAGKLAADVLLKIFTKEENLPATKGDIKALKEKMKRYHLIINVPQKENGTYAHFDIETKRLIYF